MHFESEEAALKAIEKVNGMLLNGKIVYVGKFIPRQDREKQMGDRSKLFTNVYVKNIGSMLDEDLRDLFSKYGKINSCVVMKHPDGTSKGFGFVSFEDPKSADRAVSELHEFNVNGQSLYVNRAQKKSERQMELKKRYEQMKMERFNRYQGVNLYVKNLDDSIDDDRLRKEFEAFGNITSVKVMVNEEKRSKGFGFVCFSAPDEATKAVTEMNGRIVGTKPLYVALAQRKEDRKAFLATQYIQRARMQQTVTFPASTPTFLLSTMPQGPRFYNHINHIRAAPRWPTAAPVRPNGSYLQLGNTTTAYRVSSRPSIPNNSIRNSIVARPITGGQPLHHHSRPNSKYTANTPNNNNNVIRPLSLSLGNGGDNLPINQQSATVVMQSPDQKQILGERLYPVVEKMYPDMAGKITGMLLEIDNHELMRMIENQDSLRAKVEEAIAVLQAHQQANKNKVAIAQD